MGGGRFDYLDNYVIKLLKCFIPFSQHSCDWSSSWAASLQLSGVKASSILWHLIFLLTTFYWGGGRGEGVGGGEEITTATSATSTIHQLVPQPRHAHLFAVHSDTVHVFLFATKDATWQLVFFSDYSNNNTHIVCKWDLSVPVGLFFLTPLIT